MKTIHRNAVLSILILCFVTGTWYAQASQSCKIEIQKPQAGDTVGMEGDVQGSAVVPSGMFLWVFVHRKGLATWWSQGDGPASVDDKVGDWLVLARFGDQDNPEKDANKSFEIIAVVVEQKDNQEILTKLGQWRTAGRYPGMPLPAPTSGSCRTTLTVVTRK